MANYLMALPKVLSQEIIIKVAARTTWRDLYVLYDPSNMVHTLLSVCGTCKNLCEASDCRDVYWACRVGELPDLVAKFVDLPFVHRNLDFLYLKGIRTIFADDDYSTGLKLLAEAMEARNLRGCACFACWSC